MSPALPLPADCGAMNRRFGMTAFAPSAGLEEVCVADAAGVAVSVAFLLTRAKRDTRLAVLVVPRHWLHERGRPYEHGLIGLGLAPDRLLVITPKTEAESLWALEETLRSGAAGLAIGAVEGASLVATRRLDMIAREAGAMAALVRTTPQRNLSAARRRWRLSPAPSATHPWDSRASGAPRWHAVLERSRDGALGQALLEFDHETLRLHLADGLAGDGLAPGSGTGAADPERQSGLAA